MIDCEYIKVNEPIKHSDYKKAILKYCNVKYAPFDKDGNGNIEIAFKGTDCRRDSMVGAFCCEEKRDSYVYQQAEWTRTGPCNKVLQD